MIRFAAAVVCVAAFTAAPAVLAQDLYHLRGTLEGVSGNALTISDDAGATSEAALGDESPVFVVDRAAIEDIAEGQFVGITSIVSGGERVALEVHIFEESLRGLAEGHYPWDLVEEENMMTNANVATVVASGDGRQLTVDYKDGDDGATGTQTIVVPPSAAIVDFFSGDRAALVPGERVFLLARDTEDGGVFAVAVVVGRGGVEPPM